jgi:hypothetical protein
VKTTLKYKLSKWKLWLIYDVKDPLKIWLKYTAYHKTRMFFKYQVFGAAPRNIKHFYYMTRLKAQSNFARLKR